MEDTLDDRMGASEFRSERKLVKIKNLLWLGFEVSDGIHCSVTAYFAVEIEDEFGSRKEYTESEIEHAQLFCSVLGIHRIPVNVSGAFRCHFL